MAALAQQLADSRQQVAQLTPELRARESELSRVRRAMQTAESKVGRAHCCTSHAQLCSFAGVGRHLFVVLPSLHGLIAGGAG